MSDDLKPGTIRVVAGPTAAGTTIEVWCGPDHGWQHLRGVTALSCDVSPERLASISIRMEAMVGHYYQQMTDPERVALQLVGLTPEMMQELGAGWRKHMGAGAI